MIGRTIVLLILIAILSVGGLIWFDYLNIIDAKSILSPIYSRLPIVGEPRTQPKTDDDINLDTERLAVRLEALDFQKMEMDAEQQDLALKREEIEYVAQEMQIRQQTLDDMQNSLIAKERDAEDKDRNIEQNARRLTSMPPQNAVNIIAELDNQMAIDVIRKTEEIAGAEGRSSIVPYWFSLMEPARAAELQSLMAVRPSSL